MDFLITEVHCKQYGFTSNQWECEGIQIKTYTKEILPGVIIEITRTVGSDGEFLSGHVELIINNHPIVLEHIVNFQQLSDLYKGLTATTLTIK